MEKEQQIKRIRRPVHLTLSEDAINLLKSTGNTTSRVIDRLVLDAFTESKPIRVIFGKTEWARRDSNLRPPPCDGYSLGF